MTENIDDLIAEAREAADKKREIAIDHAPQGEEHDTDWWDDANLLDRLAAALAAVQPVTPDRETLIDLQLASYAFVASDGFTSVAIRTNEQAADVLLASGVLGQPQPLDSAPEIPGFEGTLDALDGLTIRKGTQ